MNEIQKFATDIINNIEKVIVGKTEVIELLLVALLCDGHVLLEDVPGTGKTMMARAMAISLGGSFKRLQCTPDLLPNDVTGVSIFNQRTSEFEFRPGPIFVNILLVDEINRATPRTQSALLEAMQEQQVTIDGITHVLPRPFLVLATQNPVEFEGTFPLPEAQLDRFLMRLKVGYPQAADEKKILDNLRREHPILQLQPVEIEQIHPKLGSENRSDPPDGLSLLQYFQRQIWEIHIDESLQDYIVRLVNATRTNPNLVLGGSPRASLALFKASQALAALRGRDHVLPEDIKFLTPYTVPHRLIVRPEAELRGHNDQTILNDILKNVPLAIEPTA